MIALDNLFALLYASLFVVLGVLLRRVGRPRGLVDVAVGMLLTIAVLDYAENLHFLVMLADSEAGRPPSSVAISAQVLASLLKFHVSYVGLFLLGLALPRRTASERALANLLVFVRSLAAFSSPEESYTPRSRDVTSRCETTHRHQLGARGVGAHPVKHRLSDHRSDQRAQFLNLRLRDYDERRRRIRQIGELD